MCTDEYERQLDAVGQKWMAERKKLQEVKAMPRRSRTRTWAVATQTDELPAETVRRTCPDDVRPLLGRGRLRLWGGIEDSAPLTRTCRGSSQR